MENVPTGLPKLRLMPTVRAGTTVSDMQRIKIAAIDPIMVAGRPMKVSLFVFLPCAMRYSPAGKRSAMRTKMMRKMSRSNRESFL